MGVTRNFVSTSVEEAKGQGLVKNNEVALATQEGRTRVNSPAG